MLFKTFWPQNFDLAKKIILENLIYFKTQQTKYVDFLTTVYQGPRKAIVL